MKHLVSLTGEAAPPPSITDFAGLSRDTFWELDDTLQFTWISERIEHLTGFGPHGAIGKSPWEIFDANPLEDIWCRLRADFDACRPFHNAPYKFIDRDGRSRRCVINGNPFFDSSGAFKGFRGIIAEQSDVCEAEFATETRYREIFELLPVSLFEEDWSGVKYLVDQLVDQGVGNLRAYFKSHPEYLVEAASKIKIVDVNQATLENFNATDKSSLLTILHGRLSQKPFDNFGERLAAFAEGQTTLISEAQDRRVDGSDLHLRVTIRIPDANRNDWSRVLSAIEDITERKRAEKALQASEQGLANAQRLAHLGHWDWDIVSGNLHMSDEAFRIYGFEPQAFTATLDTCLQAIHLDDRDRVTESVEKSISLGTPFNNEFRILRPDGTLRHVHERGEVTFGDDGAPMRLSGSVYDITERKLAEEALRESESRLRQSVRLARLGFLVWDEIEEKCLYSSEEAARIAGAPSAEALTASLSSFDALRDIIHPDDRATYDSTVAKGTADKSGWEIEFRIIRPNGDIRHLHEISEPVLDNRGVLVRTNVVIRDITEQRQAEQASREYQENLKTFIDNSPSAISL
ncbi:MAG: PAS domain-containing protein, partial [Proteobacteria bacterium]|nr:PAS domain-containing protein [Pseudomonadota bacterium]